MKRTVLIVAAGVALALAVLALWSVRTADGPTPGPVPTPAVGEPPPPDPRVTYAGPYRNVRPDVRYTGDAECVLCHVDIGDSFRQHPMGRSVTPMAEFLDRLPPLDAAHHNPFPAFGSTFLTEREGDRLWHREVRKDDAGKEVYRLDTEAQYAIGSGSHGHSFLNVRDGFVTQTAVSWFSQKGIWDASPGFPDALQPGRPVDHNCLFCHVNRAHPDPDTVNRNVPPIFTGHAIGCERCHGPGELHLAALQRGDPFPRGPDLNIVNPRHLPPALREAVCQQCHLKGESRIVRRGRDLWEFRPGLAGDEVLRTFVRPAGKGGALKSVGHVEQMYSSRCFERSAGAGQMGCISCHDPHEAVPPERQVTWYQQKCMACHQDQGCSLPAAQRLARQPDDSCVACHMPKSGAKDIVHAALTDHRILRQPEPATPGGTDAPGPVVPFHGGRADDPELARDSALAQLSVIQGGGAPPPVVYRTVKMLEEAVARAPDDLSAWKGKGIALLIQGRSAESLAAFEEALKLAPKDETGLNGAAEAAGGAGRLELARDYRLRSIAANPYNANHRERLVRLLVFMKRWDEAGPAAEEWIRINPASADARAVRAEWLALAGRKEEARAELARFVTLRPPDGEKVKARIEALLK